MAALVDTNLPELPPSKPYRLAFTFADAPVVDDWVLTSSFLQAPRVAAIARKNKVILLGFSCDEDHHKTIIAQYYICIILAITNRK
ncbi:hypothetical protein [Mucilaginibacter antarcticus]|uniref:hypothetical protein n=1 Tax=Mucilaginibacter antarcticus TaxID=1855725 RepID=UPI00362AF69F